MFEQDRALAHQAWKMVAFLDCETPDFMSPMLLSADTINIFH